MKKGFKQLCCVIAILTGVALNTNAQEIGVRLGGTSGFGGAAIDGVFSAGSFSRIHANVGFYKGGVGVDAIWDFLNKPMSGESINWYLGIGPSVYVGNSLFLGVSGEIGLEYRFESLPFALGLDWRPTFLILKETQFGARSFGVNFRYIIGD